MSDSKEEYVVYFHIQRGDTFLLNDKTFGPMDSPKLKIFDDVEIAQRYIEDKNTDKVVLTLWIIGSKELNEWLKICSQK